MFYNHYAALWEAVPRPLQSLLQTCQEARDDKDVAVCPTLPPTWKGKQELYVS